MEFGVFALASKDSSEAHGREGSDAVEDAS